MLGDMDIGASLEQSATDQCFLGFLLLFLNVNLSFSFLDVSHHFIFSQ